MQGGVTELRGITPSELERHNTRDDCWQAYGGKVYNVGPFLKFHPGGDGEMMRGAGKDGASAALCPPLLFATGRPRKEVDVAVRLLDASLERAYEFLTTTFSPLLVPSFALSQPLSSSVRPHISLYGT